MERFQLIAPCHFGLEAVAKREIQDLGAELSAVEDGKVSFWGDARMIAEANIRLRTVERVLLQAGQFRAETFEELFEGTKSIPWEKYLPRNAKFWVAKANSISSKLFSPTDIQSVMKKAIVERLKAKYHVEWFPEDGESYPLRVTIRKDLVTVGLDTTGASLHKRGYRKHTAKAPITETLAAALLSLTPWKGDRILVDPFCGSGTFPIEAALMAAHIAPGLRRDFLAERWQHLVRGELWEEVRECAQAAVNTSVETDIQGYDIDAGVVQMARENAKLAGVDHLIHFQQRPVSELSHSGKYGFLITNPPYGERLEAGEDLQPVYRALGERFAALPTWSLYLITAFEGAQDCIGRKADKNRKVYNGMMKTYFYQYAGPKPKRTSRPAGREIILATGNKDKAREVREILGADAACVKTMREAGIDIEIEETGETFEENALQKARAVRRALPPDANTIVLADDSGLEIDALNGEPGVRSARYLGEDTPHEEKNKSILARLAEVSENERTARFVCAVAVVFPDGTEEVVRKTMEGKIGYAPRGENGFGYDPIFYLPDLSRSNSELSSEEKNAISHRGKAFRAVRECLSERGWDLRGDKR